MGFLPSPVLLISTYTNVYLVFLLSLVLWSILPTMTVFRPVRPSVHPERFPDISWKTHERDDRQFGILTCPDHLQNWLVYGHGLLIFLLLAPLWLNEMGQVWISGVFRENVWGWLENLHADVSWLLSKLISLWSRSADCLRFGATLTSESGQFQVAPKRRRSTDRDYKLISLKTK